MSIYPERPKQTSSAEDGKAGSGPLPSLLGEGSGGGSLIMKKYIELQNASELLDSIVDGKRVEGVLFIDKNTGRLTFKAYNKHKTPQRRRCDRLVCNLEHGWVKESVDRMKVYQSIPKCIGTPHMLTTLEREMKEAQMAIINEALDLDEE